MKIQWKVLLISITMWIVGEIFLNLVGLDEFADRERVSSTQIPFVD